MKKVITLIILFFVVSFIFNQCNKSKRVNNVEIAEEKIHCMECGKDLSDDYYNRISPNGKGYYCTPCYQQTMRDIREQMRAEGYN